MRRHPTIGPGRQEPFGRLPQTSSEHVVAGTPGTAELVVEPFGRDHRGVRVVPIRAEAVSHIAEPPVDELVRAVDRGHQPLLRPAAARALPEPDMQLAKRAEIGSPITKVELRALSDTHPDQSPE